MLDQQTLQFSTRGRGTTSITGEVMDAVRNSGIQSGICHLFIQHTSASLILCENADRTVREDLDAWMARLVKDGDSLFKHNDEGPDDMAAHIRTILTQSALSIPVRNGRCDLGTWQGIYLWEHRTHAHRRNISITIMGE